MGIIAFVILGLLAKALLPQVSVRPVDRDHDHRDCWRDPGEFAAALFGAHPVDDFFDTSTWLMRAIVGSIILLLLYRLIAGRSKRRHTLSA